MEIEVKERGREEREGRRLTDRVRDRKESNHSGAVNEL
jgi:hypothetical protein